MRLHPIRLAAALFLLAALLALPTGAEAQSSTVANQLPITPLRFCQITASGTVAGLGSGVCASFTGTGSGTNLTVTSVTGKILVGDAVAGTGVPASTTIASQTSGPAGGAGVYVTSAATTSSSASLTSGSIPPGATAAFISVETANIRYRDDGAAPTTSVGQIVPSATNLFYSGTLSAMQIIAVSGSPVVDVSFYRGG